MSLEAILAGIETTAEAELGQLHQETEAQIQRILADAGQEAVSKYEAARQAVLRPTAAEKARRLHTAWLEAEQITAAAQEKSLAQVLNQVHHFLSGVRDEPAYPAILRRLIEEAVITLGEGEMNTQPANGRQAQIAIDARDETLVPGILRDLSVDLAIKPILNSWGGVVLSSNDGRIIVNNTLESRLERAAPLIRQTLAEAMDTAKNDV